MIGDTRGKINSCEAVSRCLPPGGGAPSGPGSRLRENSALCLVPKANMLWAVTRSSRKGWPLPVSSRKAGPKWRGFRRGPASSEDQAGLSGSRGIATPPYKPCLTRSAHTGPMHPWARPEFLSPRFPVGRNWGPDTLPDAGYDGHCLLPGGWKEGAASFCRGEVWGAVDLREAGRSSHG